VAGGTFYPEPGVNRYTRTALDAGARIFKVHFQGGDFSPAHALLDAVWGVLAEAGINVIVHAGSGPFGNVHTGRSPFSAVLRRHPDSPPKSLHLGMPEYVDFPRTGRKLRAGVPGRTTAADRCRCGQGRLPGRRRAGRNRCGCVGRGDERSGGVCLLGDRIRPGSDSTTVPVRDCEVTLTGGPYAETKDLVAGFDMIEPSPFWTD
jgi:hypothetical protein